MFLNPAVSNLSTKEEGERGGVARETGDKVEYRVEYSDFSFFIRKG
jgi:hypothetical protein